METIFLIFIVIFALLIGFFLGLFLLSLNTPLAKRLSKREAPEEPDLPAAEMAAPEHSAPVEEIKKPSPNSHLILQIWKEEGGPPVYDLAGTYMEKEELPQEILNVITIHEEAPQEPNLQSSPAIEEAPLIFEDEDGKMVISPLANPNLPYDENKLFRINGGWGELGERTIARWYTMYATIIQCRDWLPDEIGGVVWLAMDNVLTSVYIPVYCGATDLAEPYKTPGRPNGFTKESAWWAFNHMGTLASQRWGDMRHDVDDLWIPIQTELFENQANFEAEALKIHKEKPKKLDEFLTKYAIEQGDRVVNKAWKFGDFLWTKYDEKF